MYTYRTGSVEDVIDIFRIRTQVTENMLDENQLAAKGITHEAVSALIAESDCCWVAMDNRQCIGFVIIDNLEGSLFALFVDPVYQGKGVGSALLKTAELALFINHPVLWLETDSRSSAASFYCKHGWSAVRVIENHDMRYEKQRG